jgi:hemolysin activation/secretion protein
VPDAGQTIRELQQLPELSVPKTTSPLQILPASAPSPAPTSVPVTVPVPVKVPAAAPVPAPTPETPPVADTWKTLLENKPVLIEYTNFVPGTIKLKPEIGNELDSVVGFAREYPDEKLEIIGYSDSKASPLLSLGLADSVRNYLVTNGVAGNRITVQGEGAANPIGDNNTREGRARNRRVEISTEIKEEIKTSTEVPSAAATFAPVPVPVPSVVETPAPVPTPEAVVPAQAQPSVEVKMMVKSIHVSGNTSIATAKLEALLSDLVGSEHTLAELNDGAERITAYYREHGYIVSRAYIPPQEIKDGAVMIGVQEGRIGEQRIQNQSRLSNQQAEEYLNAIKSGDVLQAAPVERAILLLNETPGVGAARATLQPGASVGSTDLVVELSPSEPYYANIQVDNYGSYFTGENRLGAELALNSPLMIGDLITFRALVTDQNLTYGYFAYQVPVGGSGLRVGVTYSGTSYSLNNEFASLRTQGTATIGSIFTVYPFIRSQQTNLAATLTLENKLLNDEYVITSVTTEKQVDLATIGFTFNHRDYFGGGGITMFNLSLAKGNLSMDDISLFIDKNTLNTNGPFSRINYNLNRMQRLSESNQLFLALSGQYANKNLNSSEQLSLGGAYGVRAYPQGEAFGDEGQLATLELRHNFTQRLQGVMFFDAGSIKFNHDPFFVGPNTRSLSGGGVGVNANIFTIDIKAYLAVRGSGGLSTSDPTAVNDKSRLWLQLGKYF